MITEADLLEAIAECQGTRNPNASTCIKLAAFYTILDHIREDTHDVTYSYSPGPAETVDNKVSYTSDTEFAGAIRGMNQDAVFQILDEAMEALQVLNPRLYAGIMRKLEEG